MPNKKTAKSKIQQITDYLRASGETVPGAVIKHFKEKGFKVEYGEIRTAKQRAFPDKYPPNKVKRGYHRASAARNQSANGIAAAVTAAAELVEKVGGVAAAKTALATVEKIRGLPA